MKKAIFNWSGGKDSALALRKVLEEKEYEIVSLLTTVNRDNQRSSMHAIPVSLLHEQAKSLGFPLYVVDVAPSTEISNYEDAMRKTVNHFKDLGVEYFIFGDIYLSDVRQYREKQLEPYGITVVEPIWGMTTDEVMQDFISSGLKTIVVTTMADVLGREYMGTLIDKDFVEGLPEGIDICGENGEYHTFCYGGDIFSYDVPYSHGEPIMMSFDVNLDDGTTKQYSYWYANLLDK